MVSLHTLRTQTSLFSLLCGILPCFRKRPIEKYPTTRRKNMNFFGMNFQDEPSAIRPHPSEGEFKDFPQIKEDGLTIGQMFEASSGQQVVSVLSFALSFVSSCCLPIERFEIGERQEGAEKSTAATSQKCVQKREAITTKTCLF